MASQGPLYPGTVATGNYWTNLANLAAADNTYASAVCPFTGSANLTATNFGFSIPSGATINGIEVTWKRKASVNFAVVNTYFNLTGSVIPTEIADYSPWPFAPEVVTYGGPTDLWGTSLWTPSVVNDSGFGIDMSCADETKASNTAYIDYIRITVYYTSSAGAGGGTATATGNMFLMF